MKNSRQAVTSGFLWRLMERFGVEFVDLFIYFYLMKLVPKDDFGTIALVVMFAKIMQVFVEGGLGTALIQKKKVDELDYSTVFYFNIFFCLVMYALLYLMAPLMALLFDKPELTALVRVLGLTVIISGAKNIQQAYVSRNLLFKRFFFSNVGGIMAAAVVGIWMAYQGYGVWALVANKLVIQAVGTVILWVTVRWRPKWMFSFERLKILFSYGWKMLLSNLLNTVYDEFRLFVIGLRYNDSMLADYSHGRKIPNLVATNVNTAIDSVLLPVMSTKQDDRTRVRAMTRRAIKTSSFIMWPMMVGLAACAAPLMSLFPEEWASCVTILRICCVSFAFYPVHTANLNAIKAMGRSDLFLKMEILKKSVGIVATLITMWISVEAIAYSLLVTTFISQIINSWPNRKLLGYTYVQQIKDILPSIFLALFMGAAVLAVSLLPLNGWQKLLIQIPLGMLLYIGGAKLLRFETFDYILSTAKKFLHRKGKAADGEG